MSVVKVLRRKARRAGLGETGHGHCRVGLEALEPRLLLSAVMATDELLAGLTTTRSEAAISLPSQSLLLDGEETIQPLTNTSGPLINLPTFRGDSLFAGINGSGFSTVIIDTGIDLNHPFFGPDADGNGVADRIVFHWDFADGDNNASDNNNHGSNVASIVASSDALYTGIAPGADIIALKVFKNSGGGTFGYVEQALQWVVANAAAYNIASVNMSLGDEGNYSSAVSQYGIGDELAALAAMDVIVVAAAGNDFYQFASAQGVSYPAADPNVIAVSAVFDSNIDGVGFSGGATAFTTGPDVITPFSQRDENLTVTFAPGSPITGADRNGGVIAMHGTSQASPHISGVAVLAQQLAVQELGRRLSVAEFSALLQSTGVTIIDGDDENDNVVNTGLPFTRVDVHSLGLAILNSGNSEGTGSISGIVWNDLNQDGIRDAGEPGLEDWIVFLDHNQNGIRDAGERLTFTSVEGSYSFTNLTAGAYHVAQIIPDGATQTYPGIGGGGYLELVAHWDDTQPHEHLISSAHEDDGGGGKGPGGSGQYWADVWGEGDFAYLGHYSSDSTVDIVHIADLDNVHLAAKWVAPVGGLQFADVQVTNGIGYFGSDNGGGVYIVDLSDPHHPVTLSHIGSAIGGHNQVHTLYVDGDHLYEVTSRNAVIKVFDVSDPANPVFVREFSSPTGGPVHEITVKNGRLYTAVIDGTGHADIFDVSDIANAVTHLGTFVTGSSAHTSWANDAGTVLAVARETAGGDVKLWNIEDPANVTLLATIDAATYGLSAHTAHQPMIVGDKLYVAWYQAGVQVFDISNPTTPIHLGGYDTYPGTGGGYQGNWGVFAMLGEDRILASDMDGGLFVLSSAESRQHTVVIAEGQAVGEVDFGIWMAPQSVVQIIDNGQAGFSTTGPWTHQAGEGLNGTNHYAGAGNGGSVAAWTFSNLAPGIYRVSATWSTHANRASNAPYTVSNDGTLLASVAINQKLTPDDLSENGAHWEDLATVQIVNGSLIVRLTNAANGYVIADAVRIEKIGDIPEGPEIELRVDGTAIADGAGALDFGSVAAGSTHNKTVTVHNLGTQNLTLGSIALPTGFVLVSSPATTVTPGQSTTFIVGVDTSTPASYGGILSLDNNDADENPYNINLSASVVVPPQSQIIDNGQAGFSTTGPWTHQAGEGLNGTNHYAGAGNGGSVAAWTFSNLAPGIYRVSATWSTHANRASNAPYTVSNDGTLLASVAINQKLTPDDLSENGAHWEDLATVQIVNGSLIVRLTNAANGYVIADAVRIEKIGD